jgi:hypothetical protein
MISVKDVLEKFPGAKVIEIRGGCDHCSGDRVRKWRRGGKLVQAVYPDGQKNWICHYCGRVADLVGASSDTQPRIDGVKYYELPRSAET